MVNFLFILQIFVSSLLIVLILLQAKGVGLGRAWGGGGEFYKSRRGVEKIVFYATIVLVVLFLITSISSLLFS
ncbi:preprotein translocase subunit SecG [Candidatus Gottesmanbacteria bacterium]|nr:preprotein translocase subunit SecG [Candidatus Gottesmanbacteria bacterium]